MGNIVKRWRSRRLRNALMRARLWEWADVAERGELVSALAALAWELGDRRTVKALGDLGLYLAGR